ncbi:uncharacterized protein LOC133400288 isoform X4 [Phycodurus eques]|uniref:uncharacterized protein LOC133400288 isoform X4 n=1 Tax=Phycodurus eques TaxID=693459 RepID=UPI002ACE9A83|nr:uncharacterized protein LOC133400288 isoform X4 [Phycodurus eques]
MLKELVRERLIAAADEIFGLFERTIASYEEQLCRAREETERHRRQLEDVYKSHMVLHREDVLQRNSCAEVLPPHPQGASSNLEHSHLPHIKKEEEEADVETTAEDPHLPTSYLHSHTATTPKISLLVWSQRRPRCWLQSKCSLPRVGEMLFLNIS